MKRISLARVMTAVDRLGRIGLPKAGMALPGFFALKQEGVNLSDWVTVAGTHFATNAERLYKVPGAPSDTPYFDPLKGEWKAENWPRGSTETALKRDSTPLRRDRRLVHRGTGENREWQLKDGYVDSLPDYVKAPGIPALEFAIWFLRGSKLPDNVEVRDLVRMLQSELNLTDDEFTALFDPMLPAHLEPGDLTDEDWDPADLLSALPPPATHTPAVDGSGADEPETLFTQAPRDKELVANLLKFLREDELFDVSEELVRNVLYSLRVDRIVVLIGKPGTGKTEFVRAFTSALKRASGSMVHLVESAITEETAEFDLIGYRDLGGRYVPSRLMDELNRGNPEHDLYLLLLDELNLATVDAYGAKIISGITNRVSIDLPGSTPSGNAAYWFPSSGRWTPHNGVLIVGTMNSYLEDPTRKQLSVPIKRRSNLITMPDPVLQTVRASAATDHAPDQFRKLCRLVLDQAVQRLRVRGTSVIDGPLVDQLAADAPEAAVQLLWRLAQRLAVHDEVPFTLGLIQSILRYVQTSEFDALDTALDIQVEQKVLPVLRGDASLLDDVALAMGPGNWPRATGAMTRMRRLAEENANRLRPLA